MGIHFRILYLILLTAAAVFSGELKAAPQILGLVASAEPTQLTCTDGVCKAEFSAFCLQEHRKSPNSGTVYLPSIKTELTLSVQGREGEVHKASVAGQSSFVSRRNFAAVEISVPAQLVRSIGDGTAFLSVGPQAALIPKAEMGDENPLSADEVELYTGPLRTAADQAIARLPSDVQAAKLLSRMVNALPEKGNADRATRYNLWEKEVGKRAWSVSEKAYNHASRAFRICKGDFNRHGIDGMRGCLSLHHDAAMTGHTRNVWKELKPGG